MYANVTAREPSSSEASIFGDQNAASQGACTNASINGGALNKPVIQTWVKDNEELISGFSFCYCNASIFYSQMPLGVYLAVYGPQDKEATALRYKGILEYHVNALAALTNEVPGPCSCPPKCPSEVVVSATWLPPNGKLVNITLQSVAIDRDSVLPGTVAVTGVQYYDTQAGKPPKRPLAVWPTQATRGDVSTLQVGAGLMAISGTAVHRCNNDC